MSEDRADPALMSRRAMLAISGAAPLLCASVEGSTPVADTLIGRCAQWLAVDFESDRLALRWAMLETKAVAEHDYFRMGERERLALPMGPEMAAIEVELDRLFNVRRRHFNAIIKMTPKTVHETASLIVIASRIEAHDPGPSAPLVRKALAFVAAATCPSCGAPYIPQNLTTPLASGAVA